jgi:hypothetical protein
MRYAILLVTGLLLQACSVPMVVQNPQTGETVTCTEGWRDQSPWSQREACVSDHLAQGWAITR